MKGQLGAAGASLVIVTALTGCGGGGAGPSATDGAKQGMLKFTVIWPQRTSRFIPHAANDITAVVKDASGNVQQTQMLPRPSNGISTTVNFTGLAPGSDALVATAFPNADGSGVAQATGSIPATVVAGQTTNVTVTMDSTITQALITPPNPSVAVGGTATLTVTYKDASNNTVLVDPSFVTWSSANTTEATVGSAAGLTTTLTGKATGNNITITASDSEPGGNIPNGTTMATVTNPTSNVTLAVGPWPKFGADLQNTGRSAGAYSSATGVVKWQKQYGALSSGLASIEPVLGSDGTLYYGTNTTFLALNSSDGSTKWSFTPDSGVVDTAAIGSNGWVYFATVDKQYALDTAAGSMKWSTAAQLEGSMTFSGGALIESNTLNSSVAGLRAANATMGGTIWNGFGGLFTPPIYQGFVPPPITPDGKTFYSFTGNGALEMVDAASGNSTLINNNALGRLTELIAIGASGTLYLPDGGTNDQVVALQPTGGAVFTSSGTPAFTPPTIGSDGTVYVAGQIAGSANFNAVISAINGATGIVKWQVTIPVANIRGAMAIDANGILFASVQEQPGNAPEGHLLALDTTKAGKQVFDLLISNGANAAEYSTISLSIAGDGSVIMLGGDGTITAVH